MRRLLLLLACCVSIAAHAAIITERNDVYNGVGCLPPPAYTFVGSASRPGIESQWIPYGTYTGGIGGTEYTRVTSHLMGVIASALGGLAEREMVGWGSALGKYLMRPPGIPNEYATWRDGGEFLASATNQSVRIADQLNLPLMYMHGPDSTGTNTYVVPVGADYRLEPRLIAAAAYYGSRCLDDLTGNATPPISSSWTDALPYNAADAGLWKNVNPTYSMCTSDVHFLTFTDGWRQYLPYGWAAGGELVWGSDIVEAYGDLQDELYKMPLDVTLEDVLSYDTGLKYEVPPRLTNDYWTIDGMRLNRASIEGEWDDLANAYIADWDFYTDGLHYVIEASFGASEWRYFCFDTGASETIFQYLVSGTPTSTSFDFEGHLAEKTELRTHTDDYTHWTNGTTRLDWKRLGIICQLERQMETTYESLGFTDELPLWHMDTEDEIAYESGIVKIPLPVATHNGQEMAPTGGLFKSVNWSRSGEEYSASTNNSQWSTPTCRTPAPSFRSAAQFPPHIATPLYLGKEQSEDMIAYLAEELERATTNGVISHVAFNGNWGSNIGSMSLDYFCHSATGEVWVVMPSNTVEVSSSTGFHEKSWRDYPIAQDNWFFQDGNTWLDFDVSELAGGGNVILSYIDNYPECTVNFRTYAGTCDADNGSVTVPQITFTATGGGPVTNWMWQATGITGTNCVRTIDQDGVYWTWVDEQSSTKSHVEYNFAGRWYFYGQNITDLSHFTMNASKTGSGDLPSSWASPSVTVTWTTSSYLDKVYSISEGPFTWSGLYVPSPDTNMTKVAEASISKSASATFTYASNDKKTETISRFSNPYSSLDWDRLYSLRRSELEYLLSAWGDYSQAHDTSPSSVDGDFTWGAVKNIGHGERAFRMLNGNPYMTLQTANDARYNLLSDLSDACASKCAQRGGMPIDAIEDIGKVTGDEQQAFLDALKDVEVSGVFNIDGTYGGFYIEADVHKEAGVYKVDHIYNRDFPVIVGGYGWGVSLIYTNQPPSLIKYKDARADGYQAPVRKTLWKFKNLCDPNL